MALHFQNGSFTWFAVSEVSPPDLVVSLLLRAVKHILWVSYFMMVVKLVFTVTALQKDLKLLLTFYIFLLQLTQLKCKISVNLFA